jgi:hypothetical protein
VSRASPSLEVGMTEQQLASRISTMSSAQLHSDDGCAPDTIAGALEENK